MIHTCDGVPGFGVVFADARWATLLPGTNGPAMGTRPLVMLFRDGSDPGFLSLGSGSSRHCCVRSSSTRFSLDLREARTDTVTVEELLNGIETGSIALADFQRDFDWSGAAVRSLVATILMGWPAGSLLAVAGDHPELAVRAFEGAPEPKPSLRMIILDGQQRLTALFNVTSTGLRGLEISVDALETGDIDTIEERLEALGPPEPPSLDPELGALRIPIWAARSRSPSSRGDRISCRICPTSFEATLSSGCRRCTAITSTGFTTTRSP